MAETGKILALIQGALRGVKSEINSKYEKPAGGIPGTDLANSYIKEPSSEGTSGQVLATNGSGGRIWTTPTGSGVVLDTTLSVPGAAADAAATGKVRSKITSDLEYVVGEYNLFDKATYTDGYYINSEGSISTGSGWAYSSLIPVTDAVYRLMWEKVTTGSYTMRVHGYDANGDWVKQLAYAQESTAQIYNLDFDCTGVKSIRISISKNYTKPICLSLKKSIIEMANEADGNYNKVLDDYPFSVKTIKIEDKFLDKYNGQFTASEGMKAIITNPIRCKAGDVFSYKGRGVYSIASAVFYSKGAYVTYALHDSETAYVDITVPSAGNIDEVIFQSGKNGSWDFAFDVQKKEPDKRLGFFEKLEIPTVNALTGKKWTVCGDSFTYGDFTGLQTSEYILQDGLYKGKNKVYPYIIGNRTHCIVNNVAVCGMSLAQTSSNNFVDQYQTLIDTTSDYLTLWFGINDKVGNVPVGELMDGNNLNTDPTTFYGAWNIVLSYIRTNMPYAHVGIVITNGMDKNAQEPYTAATRAVAKYYGYPFLDLQLDTSLPMFLWCEERPDVGDSVRSAINSTFKVSNNNNHPNPSAHEFQSYFIEKWLLGL